MRPWIARVSSRTADARWRFCLTRLLSSTGVDRLIDVDVASVLPDIRFSADSSIKRRENLSVGRPRCALAGMDPRVKVTLEIEAGVPENVVRTVTENSRRGLKVNDRASRAGMITLKLHDSTNRPNAKIAKYLT